jgi:undecaprenyl-diphosphatase
MEGCRWRSSFAISEAKESFYMSFLDAIVLGIVQGLTEFLPVSSSGHLVLSEALLGVSSSDITFEIIVHLASLLAVFIYFRHSILRLLQSIVRPHMLEERRMILYLVIGTIPAGIIGVLFKDFFERAFGNPFMAAVFLLLTGAILLSTRFVKAGEKKVTGNRALLIGCGQALAILPGVSRSGSTISVALILGVKPETAAEYSFLLAIPAIGGAAILQIKELMALDAALMAPYAVGFVTTFIFALIAVYAVLSVIRRGRFDYFAYYCFAAGLLGLYLFW